MPMLVLVTVGHGARKATGTRAPNTRAPRQLSMSTPGWHLSASSVAVMAQDRTTATPMRLACAAVVSAPPVA
jgi:hypothetical protein